jgi:hypothetical protein
MSVNFVRLFMLDYFIKTLIMGYISKKGLLKYIFFNPKFKNSTNFERRISNSNIIRKQAILVIFNDFLMKKLN